MVETILEALLQDATTTQWKAHTENKKRDDTALFFIHQSVDSKVLEKIAGESSSKATWDKLERQFDGDSKVKKVKLQALRRKLELLQVMNDEKISDYISMLLTLTYQMKQYGGSLKR